MTDLPLVRERSGIAVPANDWDENHDWRCGPLLLDNDSVMGRELTLGGDIFSMDWKVPLKREDWRDNWLFDVDGEAD